MGEGRADNSREEQTNINEEPVLCQPLSGEYEGAGEV